MTAAPDGREIFSSLRASTIALLGYDDVNPLSAVQEIRVSRAISLRLIVDSAQAKQLRGESIDVRAFTDASESLERLVGGDPETAATHDFSGAREELERLLAGRAEAIERRRERLAAAEAEVMADIYRREEMAAVMAARIDWKDPPKSGEVSTRSASAPADNVVPLQDAELARLASRSPVPRSAEREAELASNAKAFRDSYGTGGAICPPAWTHPDERRR